MNMNHEEIEAFIAAMPEDQYLRLINPDEDAWEDQEGDVQVEPTIGYWRNENE